MAKQAFIVHVVPVGKEADYHEYISGQTTSSDGRELCSQDVMNTDIAEAKSLADAKMQMAKKYPGRLVVVMSPRGR